ncbi:hypothetical protein [Streptacidiphilus sp. MAP5-3]|uniref:hypothetical protein n=1 Tax=unclassified Streptacidiphilus TaxID=2643834 RepID=UPI0035150B49
MTPKPPANELAAWLRRLDAATVKHAATRTALDELIADARAAGVPLTTIEQHTPYSREWARKIADRVDAERASSGDGDSIDAPATANPNRHQTD